MKRRKEKSGIKNETRTESKTNTVGRDGETTTITTSKTTFRTTESKHVETKTILSSTTTATKLLPLK